jgi:flagellar FliJ protein
MATFRFSLQKVLDYRALLEDQAKVRYAKTQAEYLEAEHRLHDLEGQLAEQERRLYDGNPDVMERWLIEHYVRGLRDDIARTSRLLYELARIVEEARVDLVAKAKDRKILEKFRERQAERHAREERLQEQRSYDETASMRYKVAAF